MKKYFFLKWLSPGLYFLSFLVLRNKNKYIFGEWFGKSFRDNSKYIFESALKDSSVSAVWITKSQEVYNQLSASNMPVYFAYSIAGIYHQITSRYFIFSVSSRDVNCFTCGFGARIIMLGHGLPIKEQIDDIGLFKRLKKQIRFLTIDRYYKSASESIFFDDISHRQYNLNSDGVIRMPTARCDMFREDFNKFQRQDFLNEYSIYDEDINIIYLPTHRSEGSDVAVIFNIIDELDEFATRFNKVSKATIKFHLKLHHYDEPLLDKLQHENVNLIDFEAPLNHLFSVADLFIGDYSGVCYDFIFFKKPMIAYVPDFSDYFGLNRKIYIDLEDIYGTVAYNKKDLFVALGRYISAFPNQGKMYLPKYERNISTDTSLSDKCWKVIKDC
jgi:CDP-glycerol glycerophosphotransferase (TagB/SpsB family)